MKTFTVPKGGLKGKNAKRSGLGRTLASMKLAGAFTKKRGSGY